MINFLWSFILIPLFVLWLFATICIPHLEHNREEEPLWRKVLCMIAYYYDILFNITVGTLIFGQWVWGTLTRRLKLNVQGEGYRGKLARLLCFLISKIPGGEGHCDG